MNGPGRRTRHLAFVAGAALALLIVAAPPREARTVVVSEGNGDVIARLPLPSAGRLALRYRHSIYREPALETFLVGSDLSIRLFERRLPVRRCSTIARSPATARCGRAGASSGRRGSAPTSDCP
jgi:hypothetical protein